MATFKDTLAQLKANASELCNARDIGTIAKHINPFARDVFTFLSTLDNVTTDADERITAQAKEIASLREKLDATQVRLNIRCKELVAAQREVNRLFCENTALVAGLGCTSDPEPRAEPTNPAPEVHEFTIKVVGDLPEPVRMMLEALRVTE